MRLIRLFAALATLTIFSAVLPAQAPKKAAAPKAAAKAVEKAAPKSAVAAEAAGGLIDINKATAAELKAIPGIGDAYSAAIIKGRPYANKAQLKSRNVVPDGVYEKIKDKIIAKQ